MPYLLSRTLLTGETPTQLMDCQCCKGSFFTVESYSQETQEASMPLWTVGSIERRCSMGQDGENGTGRTLRLRTSPFGSQEGVRARVSLADVYFLFF